jgi:hypothetical protein
MANNIVYVENKAGLDSLLKSPAGDVGRYMYSGALKVQAAARSKVGVQTGKLKASIEIKQERTAFGQKVEIGSDRRYALLHHEGTRPHLITGRNGGMLRFTRRGRVVLSRAVVHPGTKPNPYLSSSLPIFFTTRG